MSIRDLLAERKSARKGRYANLNKERMKKAAELAHDTTNRWNDTTNELARAGVDYRGIKPYYDMGDQLTALYKRIKKIGGH